MVETASTEQSSPPPRDAPISVGRNGMGVVEIHSTLPDGVAIVMGKFGRGLVATKSFAKGSIVYRGYTALIVTPPAPPSGVGTTDAADDLTETSQSSGSSDSTTTGHGADGNRSHTKTTDFILHVYDAQGGLVGTYPLDDTNSVLDVADRERRQVYGFDGFMNHSCDANVYCPQVSRTEDLMSYDAIAMKDIHPGDDITCDYALFDYECDGHEILQCACQAPNCRGQMRGFVGVPLPEQIRILPMVDEDVRQRFFRENAHIRVLESTLPPGLELVECPETGNFLRATQSFEPDQIVFTNTIKMIPKDEDFQSSQHVLHVAGRYILLNQDEHFIHRPTYVEAIGYDTFMDHSCEPNTYQTYHDANTYTVYAKRHIMPGDKITCDYGALENQADNLPSLPTTQFQCHCGSINCRGIVIA